MANVAIIGGGITGLGCANTLSKKGVSFTLFESSDSLGGHAHTYSDPQNRFPPVDLGFMVFNEPNYPNLIRLFEDLKVKTEPSDMSLSVSLGTGPNSNSNSRVEWSSESPSALLQPQLYPMFADMVRFNREAAKILLLHSSDPRYNTTVSQFLREHGYSDSFSTFYLFPMCAALWSADYDDLRDYPIREVVSFLCNHNMLQLCNRPQWLTVQNRSKSYVTALEANLGPDNVKKNCQVSSVVSVATATASSSERNLYQLFDSDQRSLGTFTDVVFCLPPSIAADMLTAHSPHAQPATLLATLRNVQYNNSDIYVHSDVALMPQRRTNWASWNCIGSSGSRSSAKVTRGSMEGSESGFGGVCQDPPEGEGNNHMKICFVTYWLNRLQTLKCDTNVFVSLNPHTPPPASKTFTTWKAAHPSFTAKTLAAREEILKIQGKNQIYFAGAWQGYGFHEDGLRAGLTVGCQILDRLDIVVDVDVRPLPPPSLGLATVARNKSWRVLEWAKNIPTRVSKFFVLKFLQSAIKKGRLELRVDGDANYRFGNGGGGEQEVILRVYDEKFFLLCALNYDLGFARSYFAGHWNVLGSGDETTRALGDPDGLTKLFELFIRERDDGMGNVVGRLRRSAGGMLAGAFSNASGLMIAKLGSTWSYLKYIFLMDNSEGGGSLKNIHAHYDISNDMYKVFLDKETLMYSSAIYAGNRFAGGTLEQAQIRKLDTLCQRAMLTRTPEPENEHGRRTKLLDIGFGWGGLSIHAAKFYNCEVVGITLSVEQMKLARERVKAEGLEHLIKFVVEDYRTFAKRKENLMNFDRVISCEMIEAVGHAHLGEFFGVVENVLKMDGVLVMEAITTPEARYETYVRSVDLINTIVFPGSCCPSLHALMNAAYQNSLLSLEHIDNIGVHYAKTLREWRRRFNLDGGMEVRKLGFDDTFVRVWNYYLTYCEAGFATQTENCLILVWARPGCKALLPLSVMGTCTGMGVMSELEADNLVCEPGQQSWEPQF